MTRRQIVAEAKELVWAHGALSVTEFGAEMVDRHCAYYDADGVLTPTTPAERDAILAEAGRQADRVTKFLGLS